ncbi:hypothetical protein EPI10_015427 [Gossypium australe]|uniref:Uncharacterized protein n=1 Tax=Gossypium australe TaxID=47621 RepID=A0A5B6VKJ5_9ROSI|nr:hypothetical protein EPI10_015427 [Gossypium australe]
MGSSMTLFVFGYFSFRCATMCTNGLIRTSLYLHHRIQEWLQLQIFYNGLDGSLRAGLGGAFGGAFMNNT